MPNPSEIASRAPSWRTHSLLIAALFVAALALGACAARDAPALSEAQLEATVVAMVDARLTAVANDPGAPSEPPPLITPPPDRSAETMDLLIANTRHFKGAADAPVTIIEFSDFQ